MILTIDVGGTKTLVATWGLDGRMHKSQRIPTLAQYNQFIPTLIQLIKNDFWHNDIAVISLAVPGKINYDNQHIAMLGNLPWEDVDITAPLAEAFGVPVLIENDANLAGLAEARALKTTPNNFLYVTIGTGIGSGIITSGHIDPYFAHSEIGHMMVEHDGLLQRWEDLCSGRAIARDYHKMASEIDDDQTWHTIAHKMAIGFLAFLPVLQPEMVVIGGGIGTHFERYKAPLIKKVRTHLPAMVSLPPIRKALHPEEAVIYGCHQFALDYLAA